jgi:hypothetical protein
MCLFPAISAFAQTTTLVSAECTNPEIVKLQINCQSKNKKTFEADAMKDAIKIVLFEGVPNTQYNKPLLPMGEKTALQEHEAYFANLFDNGRYSDFIKSRKLLSKFKKAENKGTLFEIEVKVLQLRKDLEKNRVSNKLGY